MASNDEVVASFSGVSKVQQLRALDLQLSSAFMKGMFYNHRATGLPELSRPCPWRRSLLTSSGCMAIRLSPKPALPCTTAVKGTVPPSSAAAQTGQTRSEERAVLSHDNTLTNPS